MATDDEVSEILRGAVRGLLKGFKEVSFKGAHVAALYIEAIVATLVGSSSAFGIKDAGTSTCSHTPTTG